MSKITSYIIVRLFELKKKLSESNFKLSYIQSKSSEVSSQPSKQSVADFLKEISTIESEINSIEILLSKAQIKIDVPNQHDLDKLNLDISKYSDKEIINALSVKSGELYDLLVKRGKITKLNYENRYEIAKLLILCNKNRQLSMDLILSSNFSKINLKDDSTKKVLLKIVRRLGLNSLPEDSFEESELTVENRKVWVSKSSFKVALENLEKISKLNTVIQLKNAERQIKTFTDEEEKEFMLIQKEYLSVLKERDNLLSEYHKEDEQIFIDA